MNKNLNLKLNKSKIKKIYIFKVTLCTKISDRQS